MKKFGLTLALLSTAACGGQYTDGQIQEGDDVEDISSAVNGWIAGDWLQSNPTATALDLGPDHDRTCFLLGVGGNLSSEYGAPQPQGVVYTTAGVRVYRTGGRWKLDVHPGMSGRQVRGSAICVSNTANRVNPVGWSTGQPPKVIAPATANRRCFLTGISNNDEYFYDNNFASNNDSIRVWSENGNWYIGGSGNALGYAGCVDLSGDHSYWHYIAGTGTGTWEMAHDSGGIFCALTGIQGRFRANNYYDGVFVSYEPGLAQWEMSVSNSKRGWSTCSF